MRQRTTAALARGLWALAVLLSACGVALLAVNSSTPGPPSFGFQGDAASVAVTLATVGMLIASRRPANPLGWLLLAGGLGFSMAGAAGEYGFYATLTAHPPAPLGAQAAWLADWLWVPSIGLFTTFVFLLFPDGSLPSRGWRPVAWLAGAALVAAGLSFSLAPGPIDAFPMVVNPYGLPSMGPALSLVNDGAMIAVAATLLASGASLVWRFRRSSGIQRQQIKWLAFAGAIAAAAFGPASMWYLALGRAPPKVVEVLTVLALVGVPVAIGVAMLRYRLYDIDRIISRTVSYGLLTALLAAVYVGGVGLLAPLAGDSDLAVAGSTLAVAALFGPARRRVQALVDRRFNRARYDAAQTVEGFSARLRNEVDLDQLRAELLGVVGQTVQPTRLALWLRESAS